MSNGHKIGGAILVAFLVVSISPRTAVASSIHEVAKHGDLQTVRDLVQDGINVNDDLDEYGATALYWSALKGHSDITVFLLDNGAMVDQKNTDGDTALHVATAFGHKDIVQLLLSKGAKIDERRKEGTTSLHIAVSRNQKEVVELLLASGAEVDVRNRDGVTPLYHAAAKNLPDVVTLLLSKGADPNAANLQGDTPLHAAAAYGNKQVVELLLKVGAEPSTKSKDGVTPAQFATQQGHSEIARLLESKSAFTRYTNEQHGFSIMYPDQWTVLSEAKIRSMAVGMSDTPPSFAAQSPSASLFVIATHVAPAAEKAFTANAKKGLAVQYFELTGTPPGDWVRTSSVVRKINGVKAFLVEWKMPPMQGVTLMQKHLTLIVGKTAFFVSATSDIRSWKENDSKWLSPAFESFQVKK